MLVGLLRSPESADPAEDPEEAEARRSSVLQDLVETETITSEEAAAAAATPLAATPGTSALNLTAGLAPHFVEWIREQTRDATLLWSPDRPQDLRASSIMASRVP